jgi:cyclic pyranopterin phosphate synthase
MARSLGDAGGNAVRPAVRELSLPTAVGELYTCLFAARGRDLHGLLRGGVDDDALHAAIAAAWGARDDRYSELRGLSAVDLPKPEISYLGG